MRVRIGACKYENDLLHIRKEDLPVNSTGSWSKPGKHFATRKDVFDHADTIGMDGYIHPVSNSDNITVETGAFQFPSQLADDPSLSRLHMIKAGLRAEHYASCCIHTRVICASLEFLSTQ
jgi:hypothetical protein